MMSGYISFRMNGRELACRLEEVHEVIRAVGIEQLPGTRAPVSGLIELRGDPLPIIDLRASAYPGEAGDVFVLEPGEGGMYGVAVDEVIAVADETELVDDEAERPAGLPPYVFSVLRRSSDHAAILLVDLRMLAGLDAVPIDSEDAAH
jgi:chemotaxis signal transduction protein